MSPAATPSSRSALMTENEPAHTTTTASSEMCARAFTPPVNARGGCIVRSQRPAARDTSSVFQNLGAFVAVSVVVICTPGPDTALIIRNTLSGGRRGGIATATGVIWRDRGLDARRERGRRSTAERIGAGVSGAAARRRRVPRLSRRCSPSSRRCRDAERGGHCGRARPTLTPRRAFRQGLLSNLGNPKIAVFFVSLLPQFVSAGSESFLALAVLGVAFSLMGLAWLTLYAVVVAKAGQFLRGRVRRALDAVTGTVLVAFGIRLAAER